MGGLARDVTPEEMGRKDAWIKEVLSGTRVPFSFVYAGKPAAACLPSWPRRAESRAVDDERTQHTIVWTDPTTGLEVRFVAVDYADFPAMEWTVYFNNMGAQNTPILEQVHGLDTRFVRDPEGEFRLHYLRGDYCAADGYRPYEQALWYNLGLTLAPLGGRGTNSAFPYYNLQMPGGGLFLAVGWPGQWATTFQRDAGRELRIVAGQELTYVSLRPGEELRTPLIALLFWGPSTEALPGAPAGDREATDLERAQNLWRAWMWAHNVPRTADGLLPPPILHGNTSGEFDEMCNANEQNQQYFIDRYAEEGIHLDYWWMDAGWYPCHGRWPQTGTWEPDPTRFPNGLRAISDHARAQGVKTLVWFEPERVAPGTWLYENHPDWLLARPDSPDLSTWERTFRLLDLGNRAAWQWLVDHVDGVLREQGIDLYRQDFNIDPLAFWRSHDAPDRLGMAENLYLQGYLAYWDELRRRHPDLIIDSCASGGRRNDLETMRRAVPLHPTDYNYAHWAVKQAFHRALIQWIPFFGSNVVPTDPVDAYIFRSGHGTSLVVGFDMRRSDLDYALMRKLCEEWRRVVPYYYGDFYPLTPYTVAEEDWMAWQLHRPTEDDGLVQAFRRGQNETPVRTFRLRGLDPSAQYVVENLDGGTSLTMTGATLMAQGLGVDIGSRPGAAILLYRRA